MDRAKLAYEEQMRSTYEVLKSDFLLEMEHKNALGNATSMLMQDAETATPTEQAKLKQVLDGLLLVCAAARADVGLVKRLLDAGVDVNSIDTNGFANHFSTVPCDVSGMQAIHWAVLQRHEEMTFLLIKYKAELNCKNKVGDTPLHLASQIGNLNVIQMLVENGSDVNMANFNNAKPIDLAHASTQIRNYLLLHGDFINCRDENGDTPLHTACEAGNYETVRLLVEKGSNINLRNKKGQTPVEKATEMGHYLIVDYLVNYDINNCDKRDNIDPTKVPSKNIVMLNKPSVTNNSWFTNPQNPPSVTYTSEPVTEQPKSSPILTVSSPIISNPTTNPIRTTHTDAALCYCCVECCTCCLECLGCCAECAECLGN